MTRKLWSISLAIWLGLFGLLAISNFRFELQTVVMGILAIVTGILIAIDK